MCYKVCNFEIEAQTYIDAYCNSVTLNDLFAILDKSEVWTNRRKRLGNRISRTWVTQYGRPMRNIDAEPSRYSTHQMARYMHKALQKKGVLLPPWTTLQYLCGTKRLSLAGRLNNRILGHLPDLPSPA
jgi:hypothetical protein